MEEFFAVQLRLQRSLDRALGNFKKTSKANLTPAKIRSRIEALKELWTQFQVNHDRLTQAVPPSDRATVEYFSTSQFDVTEDTYLAVLDLMKERLEDLEPPVSSFHALAHSSARSEVASPAIVQLPPIQLPPFDGNIAEWEQFRDRFTSLIRENADLTDFARMHYLSSCLSGRARECIANLSVTADNFVIAWEALTARYENKRRLLNAQLSALLNLPSVTRESSADMQTLSDKLNCAVSSLKSLNRQPADLWDDMLVFLAVQKLDPQTRKAWNIKTSDSASLPSYADFSRFLASRIRAFEELPTVPAIKTQKSPSAAKVHAATASAVSSLACPLCNDKHFLNSCLIFVSGNPLERRDLVKQHKRCFNCLSDKHAAQNCPSKFSCRACHKKHHTMLHVPSESYSNAAKSASPASSSSQTPETSPAVHSLLASIDLHSRRPILLATAVVTVKASNGRKITVRALLDQGSEMTFISERVAQRCASTTHKDADRDFCRRRRSRRHMSARDAAYDIA